MIAWIDPSGKIYECPEGVLSPHYAVAESLLPHHEYPDDALMKLGWVKVGSSVYSRPIIDRPPTQAQINTLSELYLLSRLLVNNGTSYINYSQKFQT